MTLIARPRILSQLGRRWQLLEDVYSSVVLEFALIVSLSPAYEEQMNFKKNLLLLLCLKLYHHEILMIYDWPTALSLKDIS